MQIFGERYLRGYLHALRRATGWAARRGPAVAGLFRAAFLRTQRAPFDALGSPVTYAVIATRFSCRAHRGQQVPLRRSALRIPHGSLTSVTCAPWPCGPALPISRLAGRYPCDYYGHSVAIGLAPRRRSHVHQRCTCQRDLGVPFISFNARTGHRSSTPEDCGRFVVTLPQGPVPVSGVFPVGVTFAPSGDWA